MSKKSIVIILMLFVLLAGCTQTADKSVAGADSNADAGSNAGAPVQNETKEIIFDGQDLLPLGSVVLLKGGTKKIMICGRGQTKVDDSENTLYDYSACYYPEGIINPKELFLFNNDDIDKVFYKGFEDDEELKFRKFAKEKMAELREK